MVRITNCLPAVKKSHLHLVQSGRNSHHNDTKRSPACLSIAPQPVIKGEFLERNARLCLGYHRMMGMIRPPVLYLVTMSFHLIYCLHHVG